MIETPEIALPVLSFHDERTGLNPDLPTVAVNLERLIVSRMLIQANSGGGKSRALRSLLEGTHGRVQQIVLDPEGEFASLREQFPFVLAGEGGDVPVSTATAGVLCRKLLELRASCVINLYDLNPDDRREYVRYFLEALMQLPRELWHPVLIVIDEAHTFVPERGTGQAESTNAVIALCSQGRKRGFCPILATQRLSKLHKDAAAELLNKLIGRTTLDVDVRRAADDLGFNKEEAGQLKRLSPGEFYAYGPALTSEVMLTQTGDVRTSHPEAGDWGHITPPAPAELREVLSALATLHQEAETEARTIEQLQQRVRDLEKINGVETVEVEKIVMVEVPVEKIVEKRVEVRVEVPVLAPEQAAAFEQKADDLLAMSKDLQTMAVALMQQVRRASAPSAPSSATAETATAETLSLPESAPLVPPTSPTTAPSNGVASKVEPPKADAPPKAEPPKRDLPKSGPKIVVPDSQHRILNALATFEALGLRHVQRAHVALSAEASPTSSTFSGNLTKLRDIGLIEYPVPGVLSLTPVGRQNAVAHASVNSLDDLHDAWCEHVSASQARILRVLLALDRSSMMSRDDLADEVEASRTSSTFNGNLTELKNIGLVEYPARGHVSATNLLFPDGLN